MKSILVPILALASTSALATITPAPIESVLRSVSPTDWTLRPNNAYRSAVYVRESAECAPFPGAKSTRLACTLRVLGDVDTCPNDPVVRDEITFRGVFSASGEIISLTADGGTISESRACPR